MASNPFEASFSKPGHGLIHLALLPPSKPVLQQLSYQYPLKLVAPSVTTVASPHDSSKDESVHTVYLLTYGGGIVGGDTVHLGVRLENTTRLVLLTQGSTKVFKSKSKEVLSGQYMTSNVGEHAVLCYLPDPVQPFEHSAFEQRQIYHIAARNANLCVCDWVSEGRPARHEKWSFLTYASRNEVWLRRKKEEDEPRLLLRDNMILEHGKTTHQSVLDRMHGLGVFGTLIIHGPRFQNLGEYFMFEFKLLPRIGSKQWDKKPPESERDPAEVRRAVRVERENKDGLLWTAAATRGFVVVKFGAREVEGAKRWLKSMLSDEGSVEREVGERAFLCLR